MTNAGKRTGTTPILNHDVIRGDAEPGAWMYVLHGIFGAGRNWATVARRITTERPDWGIVLVDLRQHGASQGFPGPHTLDAATKDLTRLTQETHRTARAVLGHSFGGKVALRWSMDCDSLDQVWVIDSTPDAGRPGGSAWAMLQTIRRLPDRFATRDAAIDALTRNGVALPVAQWMATNLERTDGTLRWRFDADAIDALMQDFFRTDLWNAVESPAHPVDIHFVRATESSILDDAAIRRIEAVQSRGHVHLHNVESGHWVNADNPDAVVALLARHLPEVVP
jgi:pimeloyl-ACP methyl ester carboxylesterase